MSHDRTVRYPELHRNGQLKSRADRLRQTLTGCRLCPHLCGVDRTTGKRGECGASDTMRVASVQLHYGEEAPISGFNGSGTVFFAHCSLACCFCQNADISQHARGVHQDPELLAESMLQLQNNGAHNINLVTPTHYLPMILDALDRSAGRGLTIPIVYNTSGWESVTIVRMLEGIVDVYMPDMKYSESELAADLSGVPAYPRAALAALMEMSGQTGPLRMDDNGVAIRGLLVRHLVLPGYISNTMGVIQLLEQHVPNATLSILSQYHPAWKARFRTDDLSRFVDQDERRSVSERLARSPLTVLRQWN